jgi:heme/copper-type cytochrome/quinol oxidase subunit 2
VTVTYSSLSYQDGLENVTLSTTNPTNTTNTIPQGSAAVTAAIVISVSVIVIVVACILLFLWCRRRMRRKRKQEYMEGMMMEDGELSIIFLELLF